MRVYCELGAGVGAAVGTATSRVVLNIAAKFGRVTLPSPVTGSQPEDATKPAEQQVPETAGEFDAQHLLFPEVMSLNLFELEAAYNVGFRKPTEDFPAANRPALISETSPAKTGAEADVPNRYCKVPPT